MADYQFWTIVGMMGAGFGWVITQIRDIDKRISNLETRVGIIETRVTVIETILGMMGMPIKEKK